MEFTRFALYFAPPIGAEWTELATSWLGWDMVAGRMVAHPAAETLDVGQITERPRKYGLHGTIKPPFRLADGATFSDLESQTKALCARLKPVPLQGLSVARLGPFLALRPDGDVAALSDLAATCVEALDAFRAPPPQSELDRRRAAKLSDRQEALLQKWGYPYVMDEFRFHVTLSGRLSPEALTRTKDWLDAHLQPLLPQPFVFRDLALVGEGPEGRFHQIQRYTLSD